MLLIPFLSFFIPWSRTPTLFIDTCVFLLHNLIFLLIWYFRYINFLINYSNTINVMWVTQALLHMKIDLYLQADLLEVTLWRWKEEDPFALQLLYLIKFPPTEAFFQSPSKSLDHTFLFYSGCQCSIKCIFNGREALY